MSHLKKHNLIISLRKIVFRFEKYYYIMITQFSNKQNDIINKNLSLIVIIKYKFIFLMKNNLIKKFEIKNIYKS